MFLVHLLSEPQIQAHGVQEPILISTDGYIISGHRHRAASLLAGLPEVPVRIYPISRQDDPAGFLKLLVEMNSQRVKATNELVHESLVKIDPKAAHQQIINERLEKSNDRNLDHLSSIDPGSDGRRCEISRAKIPLLDAVKRVLQEQHEILAAQRSAGALPAARP